MLLFISFFMLILFSFSFHFIRQILNFLFKFGSHLGPDPKIFWSFGLGLGLGLGLIYIWVFGCLGIWVFGYLGWVWVCIWVWVWVLVWVWVWVLYIFRSLGLGLGPDPRPKPKTYRDPSQNVCFQWEINVNFIQLWWLVLFIVRVNSYTVHHNSI